MKVCTRCDAEKALDEFPVNRRKRDGRRSWCKQCHRDYHAEREKMDPGLHGRRSREWRKNNPERSKQLNSKAARKAHERAKRLVIDAYGGKCTCCGETDIHFLTIEHVTKEASQRHRYPNGKRISGTKLLRIIALEGFPDDITILCHNCNCSRGQYGGCPHDPQFKPRYEEVECR